MSPRGSQGGSQGGSSKRGFAAMPKDKVREIARKGGQASHGGGRRSDR
jgi:general stress protein YciG